LKRVSFKVTAVLNNKLRNMPEERKPQLHRIGSLKFLMDFFFYETI